MNKLILLLALPLSTTALAGEVSFTHQGRLLNALGEPLSGPRDVTVGLYDTQGSVSPAWQATYSGTDFADGFFAVTLTGVGDGSIDLDDVVATDASLWLDLDVQGGAPLARQALNMVPRAAYAVRTGGVGLVDTAADGTSCGLLGGMAYDTSASSVVVCDGSNWAPLAPQAPVGVISDGTTRTWADGSVAASCNGYRYPVDGQQYTGADAVTGRYTIAPAGVAYDVYCDMDTDGGGWTMVMRASNNDAGIDLSPAASGWSVTSYKTLDDVSLTNVNAADDYVSRAYGELNGNDMLIRHQLGSEYQFSLFTNDGALANQSLRSVLSQSDIDGGRVCFSNVTFPPENTLLLTGYDELVLSGDEAGDTEPAKIAIRSGCDGDSQLVQMGYTRAGHGSFEVWSQTTGGTWQGFASAFVFVR